MNLIPRLFRIDLKNEEEYYNEELKKTNESFVEKEIKPVYFDLIAFVLTTFIGLAVRYINLF